MASPVSIKAIMYQGSFETDGDIITATNIMEDPMKRIACFTEPSLSLVSGLHVKSVKYAKRGNMGSKLFEWNETSGTLPRIPMLTSCSAGSMQITCTTIPHDIKVSIFLFGNGKIKMCGGLLDPYTAASILWLKKYGVECDRSNMIFDHEAQHEGLQTFLDQVKHYSCKLIGGKASHSTFEPGIIQGQFKFGYYINEVNKLAKIAATEMKDLFKYVRGQEPDLYQRHRAFAVQMYLKGHDKLFMSFDHMGTVQIFCAKGFHDMALCYETFVDMIIRATEDDRITVDERNEEDEKEAKQRKVDERKEMRLAVKAAKEKAADAMRREKKRVAAESKVMKKIEKDAMRQEKKRVAAECKYNMVKKARMS